MALFRVTAKDGIPAFSYKEGASWRLAPGGLEALVEFEGSGGEYAEAKSAPGASEMTRDKGQILGKAWDLVLWGGTA
jgi:hypothetical protein